MKYDLKKDYKLYEENAFLNVFFLFYDTKPFIFLKLFSFFVVVWFFYNAIFILNVSISYFSDSFTYFIDGIYNSIPFLPIFEIVNLFIYFVSFLYSVFFIVYLSLSEYPTLSLYLFECVELSLSKKKLKKSKKLYLQQKNMIEEYKKSFCYDSIKEIEQNKSIYTKDELRFFNLLKNKYKRNLKNKVQLMTDNKSISSYEDKLKELSLKTNSVSASIEIL